MKKKNEAFILYVSFKSRQQIERENIYIFDVKSVLKRFDFVTVVPKMGGGVQLDGTELLHLDG